MSCYRYIVSFYTVSRSAVEKSTVDVVIRSYCRQNTRSTEWSVSTVASAYVGFRDGSVWYTKVLPVGGYHVTNDIAVGMRAPYDVAERVKIRYKLI